MLLQHSSVSNRQRYSDTLDSWKDDAFQGPYIPLVGVLSLLTASSVRSGRVFLFLTLLLSSPL